VVLVFRATDRVLGVALTLKSTGPLTTNVTVLLWVKLPLVPVITNEYVPAGEELLVVTFMVDEPEPVTDGGVKPALPPVGSPVTVNPVVPAKPFCAVMVTV
jgi:hypothetical protein